MERSRCPFVPHARVNLASIEATLVIRIFTLIRAANELIEALPRLHGNIDDMNRHRERFDNFFRMCTKLFTEVYYKFDLLRAFIEEMRTNTNRAIEQKMQISVHRPCTRSSIMRLIQFVPMSIGM